ncbi:MAG: hypothetical protein R3E93_12280 [Thiothrix sp.]
MKQRTHHLPYISWFSTKLQWRVLLGAVLASSSGGASAVFTFTSNLGNNDPRVITMTVGSPLSGVVNRVTFDVSGSNASSSSLPVTGSTDAPATSVADGVLVEVATLSPKVTGGGGGSGVTVTLVANSSAGFACVAGSGCGATIIPATSVSWVSYLKETSSLAGQDIQDGAFTGSGSQLLAQFQTGTPGNNGNGSSSNSKGSATLSNILVFSYDNATLYPAGQYSGRVTFTATIP